MEDTPLLLVLLSLAMRVQGDGLNPSRHHHRYREVLQFQDSIAVQKCAVASMTFMSSLNPIVSRSNDPIPMILSCASKSDMLIARGRSESRLLRYKPQDWISLAPRLHYRQDQEQDRNQNHSPSWRSADHQPDWQAAVDRTTTGSLG